MARLDGTSTLRVFYRRFCGILVFEGAEGAAVADEHLSGADRPFSAGEVAIVDHGYSRRCNLKLRQSRQAKQAYALRVRKLPNEHLGLP